MAPSESVVVEARPRGGPVSSLGPPTPSPLMPDLHVGLVYGGQSAEHEISILSARNVLAALRDRYRVTPLFIDREGRWTVGGPLGDDAEPAVFTPHKAHRTVEAGDLGGLDLDVVFPILHGQNGEDGVIQGFLQALGLPYVGPGVLASAACMDKVAAKRLLSAAGIPNTDYVVVTAHDRDAVSFDDIQRQLGTLVFVKPANSGSSVGISRVESADQYPAALDAAFRYDRLVLVERGIVGREIEVAVLGNEQPEASVPGEIVMTSEFYDYDSKYTDADASRMDVPADLPPEVAERIREIAVEAYVALGCEGLSRVDFFVTPEHDLLVNEINTIPGFTERSMYPVMWAATGRSNEDLVDDLITLALDRHARDSARSTSR